MTANQKDRFLICDQKISTKFANWVLICKSLSNQRRPYQIILFEINIFIWRPNNFICLPLILFRRIMFLTKLFYLLQSQFSYSIAIYCPYLFCQYKVTLLTTPQLSLTSASQANKKTHTTTNKTNTVHKANTTTTNKTNTIQCIEADKARCCPYLITVHDSV